MACVEVGGNVEGAVDGDVDVAGVEDEAVRLVVPYSW